MFNVVHVVFSCTHRRVNPKPEVPSRATLTARCTKMANSSHPTAANCARVRTASTHAHRCAHPRTWRRHVITVERRSCCRSEGAVVESGSALMLTAFPDQRTASRDQVSRSRRSHIKHHHTSSNSIHHQTSYIKHVIFLNKL